MRSPAIANDFDMTPSEIPRGVASARRRQPIVLVELQVSIDLVHQEMRAGILGDGHERVERRTVGQHPGRVVRSVHDDEPGGAA